MKEIFIILDGEMVAADEAFLASLAPGAVRGRGAFETLRVYRGRAFALDAHLRRMAAGLKAQHIQFPLPQRKIEKDIRGVLRKNCLRDARLRIAVWTQKKKTRFSVVAQRLDRQRAYSRGISAGVSRFRRPVTALARFKTMDYGCFRRAHEEARAKGVPEAVLLNRKGELVEASRANLFFVRAGVLCTPALSCGCLRGITRGLVLKIAASLGLACKTGRFGRRDLFYADEAFLTNSVRGVVPLVSVDGQSIAHGRPGRLTRRVSKAYSALVRAVFKSV